ncbi:MAG: 3D domain-containing protein [Patescibacteria group bacterium]|nr:3D domain-containing protein [Patescibacteria group bacterium]
MKTRKVFSKQNIITFISILSLINLGIPQTSAKQVIENNFLTKDQYQNYATFEQIQKMPGLPKVKNRPARSQIHLTITAYSSSPDECSGDPFITASGQRVEDGTLAYNYLPFGTKVRFPEAYGDKIFTVTDRMASYKGKYIADIWMPSKQEAKNWGVKILKMEIL